MRRAPAPQPPLFCGCTPARLGESALIDTLDLITPWGTGSNQNAAAAMQAAQVTAGILPGAALDENPGRRIAAGPARAVL